MDCPHCGEENLVGARICAVCGKRMVGAPPPMLPDANATATQAPFSQLPTEPKLNYAGAVETQAMGDPSPREEKFVPPAPSDLPPGPAASPVGALCRVCQEGFERRPDETGVPICPGCRQFAPAAGGDAGVNEVQLHPATQEQPGVDPRAGSAILKKKPVVRRASLRAGPIAAVAGLVLVVCGVGVVLYVKRDKDPAAEYLRDVKPEEAAFSFAPSKSDFVRLETTLDLNLVHEMVRAAFASRLEEVLNIQQKSVQRADVAWVRNEERGVVLDAAVECRVAMQTGTAAGADGREVHAYPWEGYKATSRLVVPPAEPTRMLGGEAAMAGRDLPPCLTVRDVDAPIGTVPAGTTWKTQLTLPLLMSRDGALRLAPFACDMMYVGRISQNGLPSYLFSVRGTSPRTPPDSLGEMNRAGGTLRGCLFYDCKTGELAEAHLTADVSAWLEKGRVEDRVHVEGTMEIRRR